jgi:hypothetical protein
MTDRLLPQFTRLRCIVPKLVVVCSFTLSACKNTPSAPPQDLHARLTAEEAGYLGEVVGLTDASCRVGMTYRVLVGYRSVLGGAWSYPRPRVTRREPVYDTRIVNELQMPGEQPRKDWNIVGRNLSTLLPPASLRELHSGLQAVVSTQATVSAATSDNRQTDRVASLRQSAAHLCSVREQFMSSLVVREPIATEAPTTAVLTLSYKPVMTPVTLSVNSQAKFSVSVGASVATPIGDIGFSVSQSASEVKYPKRLVIRAEGQRRVFLLERPFQVIVPNDYGVIVTNDTDLIVLDIAEPTTEGIPEPSRAPRRGG